MVHAHLLVTMVNALKVQIAMPINTVVWENVLISKPLELLASIEMSAEDQLLVSTMMLHL
jgi:hypothetical protein